MEICACGARRWVDQDGTPATPWQSINLGISPMEKEDAGVAPRTSPKSALDGLITCGSCGKPLVLDDTQGDQEACYACQSRCPTPRLHALRAEVLLVRTALRTVLTDENISRVLAVANDPQRYNAAPERSLTRLDLQQIRDNPKLLVLAANSTQETRDLMGIIVAEIQVHTKSAVIRYAHPLPGDSPRAGMRRQEIDLPEEILAWWTTTGT